MGEHAIKRTVPCMQEACHSWQRTPPANKLETAPRAGLTRGGKAWACATAAMNISMQMRKFCGGQACVAWEAGVARAADAVATLAKPASNPQPQRIGDSTRHAPRGSTCNTGYMAATKKTAQHLQARSDVIGVIGGPVGRGPDEAQLGADVNEHWAAGEGWEGGTVSRWIGNDEGDSFEASNVPGRRDALRARLAPLAVASTGHAALTPVRTPCGPAHPTASR